MRLKNIRPNLFYFRSACSVYFTCFALAFRAKKKNGGKKGNVKKRLFSLHTKTKINGRGTNGQIGIVEGRFNSSNKNCFDWSF